MGALLSFKLTAGFYILEIFLTNVVGENDTLMTWSEARNFCDSINSSLVDPLVDVVATDGAFWTNRRMGEQSSWIYVNGCISTSSLGSDSSRGRKVSSVWECDNLCNHAKLFVVQNSTCFCLNTDRAVITEDNLCKVQCDNCTDDFPLQCCGDTHLVTVFGKFHVTGNQMNFNNPYECLTIDCEKHMYHSRSCLELWFCRCSRGDQGKVKILDWKNCFQSECDPRLLKELTQCTGHYLPIWLPVRRRHFDNNTRLCYRCINNTLNCQFGSCDHTYKPSCTEKSSGNTIDNTTWNNSFESCFPNYTEKENVVGENFYEGAYLIRSNWIHVLGCIAERNRSFPSSTEHRIPYPSITLCEEFCNTSDHFIVKNTTCICVEYPNITDPAVRDLCTIPCKDTPPLGLYCGGISAFNVFKTYRETEILSDNFSQSCTLLDCTGSNSSLITVDCNVNLAGSGLCVKFNGGNGSPIPQMGTWKFSANYCKEKNESLPSSLSLCDTTRFRGQQQWSGLVRVRAPVPITKEPSSTPASSKIHSSSKLLSTPATYTTIISFTMSSTASKTPTVSFTFENQEDHDTTIQTVMAVVFSLVAVLCFVGITIFCIRKKMYHRKDEDGPRSQNEGGLVTYDEIQLTEPKPSIHCYDRLGDVDKEKGYTNSPLYTNTTECTAEQTESGDGDQLYSNLGERSSGPVEDLHIYSHVTPDGDYENSSPKNDGF